MFGCGSYIVSVHYRPADDAAWPMVVFIIRPWLLCRQVNDIP